MALGQNPASLPADDGPGGNNLRGGPHDVHALVLDQDAGTFRAGTFEQTVVLDNPPGIGLAAGHTTGVHTSRVVEIGFPFSDVVPSYNLDCPEGAGALFEIRFGRAAGDFWTPWYYLGFWGDALPTARLHLHDEHGAIEIDCYRSPNAWDRVQYRVKLTGTSAAAPVLRRFALACSNTLGDADLAARMRKPLEPWSGLGWTRRLPVPYRSQTVEDPKIRGSICSPTSVSMVLQYYGVNRPTAEVAARVYDPVFKLYGNWGRAVQTAYSYGVPGYLERFGDWNAVKRHICQGEPVIASIRSDMYELRRAPYRSSDGHLIVITGFDADGDVCINDPAAKTKVVGRTLYYSEDMDKAWMAHGGVGYVLQPPSPQSR